MSNLTTLDLPDGQWFRYHPRPTHGQIKVITRKLMETQRILFGNAEGDPLDLQTVTVLEIGDAWLVKDDDGHDIPWSREGIESAPQDIVQLCHDACEHAISGASPSLGNDLQAVPRTGRKAKPSPNR